MMRLVSAAVTSCLILILHVSDSRCYTTPKPANRLNTEEWGFREVCHILNIISYLLVAIAVVLCMGFVGTQALLIRHRLLQLKAMKSQQDEAHVYNTFQTERQISRAHTYAQMLPGASNISTARHSYIDVLPPDFDDYIRPVCSQCSGNV
ncbi:uncharacterized protein LOC124259106 [Haliotis rubra]|uniref:uncharacterized protein LOC124259106 n=1 Tax=Haliotis rubra TaxID=36100 RepID=UPI001EE60C92|nr:uncharacterized protein LOC124259106 [Haliotis rubra]